MAASADPPSLKLRRASMTPWPPKPWRRRLEPAASVRAGLRTLAGRATSQGAKMARQSLRSLRRGFDLSRIASAEVGRHRTPPAPVITCRSSKSRSPTLTRRKGRRCCRGGRRWSGPMSASAKSRWKARAFRARRAKACLVSKPGRPRAMRVRMKRERMEARFPRATTSEATTTSTPGPFGHGTYVYVPPAS